MGNDQLVQVMRTDGHSCNIDTKDVRVVPWLAQQKSLDSQVVCIRVAGCSVIAMGGAGMAWLFAVVTQPPPI